MSTRAKEPSRKRKFDHDSELKLVMSSASKALSDISQTVNKVRDQRQSSNVSHPDRDNAAWSFCNMMYHELMSFSPDARGNVQYMLYGTLMQAKMKQGKPHTAGTNPSTISSCDKLVSRTACGPSIDISGLQPPAINSTDVGQCSQWYSDENRMPGVGGITEYVNYQTIPEDCPPAVDLCGNGSMSSLLHESFGAISYTSL